jgi:uncharacterized repeat protein (TIGR01451 family)
MRFKVGFRKILSVIATSALLLNSFAPYSLAIAQEITPEPTPTPTEETTPTPEATIAPTESPTEAPTPTEIATPTPEVVVESTPLAEETTPAPDTTQPETQGTTSENTQSQAPPAESPTVAPSATPEVPQEHGNLTTTTIEDVDLSEVTLLNANVDGNSNITTDKPDYHPTDVVLISGTGFTAHKAYTLEIVSTDEPPVDFKDQIKADESGNIAYAYQLDGIMRPNYAVYVKTGEKVVAQTTFTDNISFGLAQCAQNDKQGNTPLGLGYCNWIGSSLGANNSKLYEGMATEQQLIAEGMTGSSHTMIVGVQSTKGGHHAYDWLVSDAISPNSTLNSQQTSAEQGITLQLNRCGDSLSNSDKTACSNLIGSGNYVDIPVPDDSFISTDGSTQTRINAYESAYGNRTVRLYSSAAITGTPTMTLAHMDGKLSGNVLPNGGDTGDSYLWYTISWTSTGANAMLAAAADIAMGGTGTGRSWGPGRGAGGISGDPYHFYLIGVDGTGGSLDNQLSADAVIPAATSSVATQVRNSNDVDITNTTVSVGTIVHDHATVDTGSAQITIPAGSTFTFHKYTTINCTGTPTDQSGVAVPSGAQTGSADSSTFTPSVGFYSYKVDFLSGNTATVANSTGICEPFTISKATLGITTTIHSDSPDQALVGNLSLAGGAHDSATVTGKVGSLTLPDVTFYFFGNGVSCSNGSTVGATQLNTVSPDGSGIAHPSTSQTNLAAGTYNFMASVASNDNYVGATGNCEPFTVDKGTSSVATELHKTDESVVSVGSSVPLATSMHDKAIVTVSGSIAPTGNVDFRFYTSLASCTEDSNFVGGTTKGSIALDGASPGVAHPSTSTGALTPGTYAFKAKWAGDSNYTGGTSSCENFTVNQGTSTVATTLHNANHDVVTVGSSVSLGTIMHDLATVNVSGSTAPAGNVNFTFFANNSCTGDGVAMGTVALDGANPGVAHPSMATSALGAGSYAFQASWLGDNNYTGATSTCEPFTVDKAQLTVTTALHNADHVDKTNNNVPLGSIMHDTATVTGGVGGFTVPTPTFTLTTNYTDSCSAGNSVANDGTEGSASKSAGSAALAAGTYAYRASVAGNDNYIGDDSDCEPFTVDQGTSSVTTELHDTNEGVISIGGTVATGTNMHDKATVTVSNSIIPTGNVDFRFYTSLASCTEDSNFVGGTAKGSIALDGANPGVAHPSTDSGVLDAGTYAFKAKWAGDSNYSGSISSCENFTVDKTTPSINTTPIATPSAVLGATLSDSATLSNGYNPTGNILFSLWGPSDQTCEGNPVFTDTVTVSGNGTYYSQGFSALVAGIWNWIASYSGDSNNNPATGDCGDEQIEIPKSNLGITTEIHSDGTHTVVNSSLPLGSSVHDSATVTGIVADVTPPDVTFYFFDNGVSCTNGNTTGGTALNTVNPDGAGIAHPSTSKTNLPAGTYNFMAVIGSNANYNGAISDCEPFTVNQGSSTLETTLHQSDETVVVVGSSIPLGTVMHDLATVNVSGIFAPTGNVSFSFYNNSECLRGDEMGSIALDGSNPGTAHPSTSTGALSAGDYSFNATWAGDNNYTGNTSSCENFSVSKADTETATQVHDSTHSDITNTSVIAGSVVHDSATVSGAISSKTLGGTVTYDFYNNGECSGEVPLSSETVQVGNETSETNALGPGSYSYLATYNGDDNYNGSQGICEPFTVVSPSILIEKTNDKPNTSAGDIVTYTLKVTNTGGITINNIDITDVLPGGFTYVPVSTTVNGIPFSDLNLTISGSGNILTWNNVGDLDSNDFLTLSYRVVIASDQTEGSYINFATCTGQVAGQFSVAPPTIDCNVDDSTVTIGKGVSFGGRLGQVLGISTELPATGSPTGLALIALGLIGIGFILKKKYVKN